MTSIIAASHAYSLSSFLQERMSSQEEGMFVDSFKAYIQYGRDDKGFVIDLDDVWKWMGFSRKDPAKRLLQKYFIDNTDYILLHRAVEQNTQSAAVKDGVMWATGRDSHGGCTKETIMMTVKTFKKFCLKANTDKADQAQDYYIKMEETVQDYHMLELKSKICAQARRHEADLEAAELETEQASALARERERHDTLLQAHANQELVYFIKVKVLDSARWIVKIGSTDDLTRRIKELATTYGMAVIIECIPCTRHRAFEKYIHNHACLIHYRDEILPSVRSIETFVVDGASFVKAFAFAKKHVTDYMGYNVEQKLEEKRLR